MGNAKRVIRQIQPINEDELEIDLRFIYDHHANDADRFIDETISIIKYHVNLAMVDYQDAILGDLTHHLQHEVSSVILRTRRETSYEEPKAATSEW